MINEEMKPLEMPKGGLTNDFGVLHMMKKPKEEELTPISAQPMKHQVQVHSPPEPELPTKFTDESKQALLLDSQYERDFD